MKGLSGISRKKQHLIRVVREGVGVGGEGEMTQALYAHMNNKIIKKRRYSLLCLMHGIGR
jgi:hypothetical protein